MVSRKVTSDSRRKITVGTIVRFNENPLVRITVQAVTTVSILVGVPKSPYYTQSHSPHSSIFQSYVPDHTWSSVSLTNALCGTHSYQSPSAKYWLGGGGVMRVVGNHTFVFIAYDHSSVCVAGCHTFVCVSGSHTFVCEQMTTLYL